MSEVREGVKKKKKETQQNNYTYTKNKTNTNKRPIKFDSLDFVFLLFTMTIQGMGYVIIKKQTNKN